LRTGSLLEVLTQRILNEHRLELLPSLLAGTFVDHDPILGLPANRNGIAGLARFLSLDGVDVAFTIERQLEDADMVAARVFGEGTVTGLALELLGAIPGLGRVRQLHVQVSTVSMFRHRQGRFTDRWGPVSIERVAFR
jgi:hypothetical protein